MEIRMPRLGVNDDVVTLAQWLVKSGDNVKKGQGIAVVETAKETSEILAEEDGYIVLVAKEGKEIPVGEKIASIGDTVDAIKFEETVDISEYKITEKAKVIIAEHNIDLSLLPKNKLIKEKDVLKLVSEPYEIAEVKSNKILLYGGGRMSKVIIDILRQNPAYSLYGIIDTNYPQKKEVFGISVIGNDNDLDRLYNEGYHKIFNTIGFNGNKHWRKPPYEMLKEKGFEFPNLIHPSATIDQTVNMGEGNYVGAKSIISADTIIGSNCFINAGSIIAHDCIISDNCHIASGAVLAGGVIVGENTLIGQNCTVYMDVKIGKNVVIQNGCNIFKDIKDNEIVMPGK